MTIKEKVEAALKDAMKSKNQERLSALRMIKAELLLKEKETGKTLEDAAANQAVQKMLKKYEKAKAEYESLGKPDEVRGYLRDIEVIKSFLSTQMMDESEIRSAMQSLVAELNATEQKDFGRVMKAFMSAHSNADGKIVSGVLKEMLKIS
ncbi:GatB/YqeY domain-containing protein [Candidatus Poribacteria bacterium]|nr:GatB/YqeY domain-containing protein [Candidatus Poribacteria bacterium]